MTTINTLRSLQKRIREATGPDRGIDGTISRAFNFFDRDGFSPPFTSDPDGLGACVALMREVLPGCEWTRNGYGDFHILVGRGSIYERMVGGHAGPNDCIRFIDAIVSARIAVIAELEAKEKADV